MVDYVPSAGPRIRACALTVPAHNAALADDVGGLLDMCSLSTTAQLPTHPPSGKTESPVELKRRMSTRKDLLPPYRDRWGIPIGCYLFVTHNLTWGGFTGAHGRPRPATSYIGGIFRRREDIAT